MNDPHPRPESPSATGWAMVQEGLARVAGQALGRFAGPVGSPRTPVSLDCPICRIMRGHPEAGPRCAAQCDGGVAKTLETGRTQLFKCHAGLSVFITRLPPAAVEADVLLGGRVFLSYEDLHAFRTYAAELGLEPDAVEALAPDIRVVELPAVKAFAEQARALAAAFAGLEEQRIRAQDRGARLRYLMEILAALEKEPPAEVPHAVLHGLGILFGAPAGVFLRQRPDADTLTPTTVFCGNSTAFDDEGLRRLAVRPDSGWLKPALEDGRPVFHDAVYDLLKAGFPAEAAAVDLFPVPDGEGGGVVALLNASLDPEDRLAIGVFSRHAGLLMERAALAEQVERQDSAGMPEISPALWEAADADALCQGMLEKAVTSMDAEQGSVLLLDPAEERLRIRAIHGIHLKYVEYVRIRPGEGIAGGVFASGQPMVVADIAREPRLGEHMRSRYRTRSFVSIPIRVAERPLGVINVADKRDGTAFSRRDLKRLIPIAQQAALAIERFEAIEKTEELRKASLTDYLTGLLNRAAFDNRLKEEVERAQRYPYASPLSLLVADIDDFKRINDTLGFFTGDDCIKACARTLQEGTRTIDSVYRRGGEEFTVILPHTSREAALTLAERLVGSIADLSVVSKHTPRPVGFTVSIGLATYPDDADSEDGLFHRANQALHVAKQGGKNRVVTLPPDFSP